MASHVRALTTWRKDAALLRLADLLNVAPVHAYGMITALTAHLMEQRKCGDLRSVPSSEIEHAAGWVGMPGHFASTVVNSYVDGRGQILHWMETAFPILKDREANTARVNAYRKKMREQQNQAADDFVSGTGGNGAASLSSASSTANQSAASPAPRRNAEGPDATRVRQSSPKSAPETPASPRTSSPRTVMGDTSPEHPANGSRIETSESRVENSLSDVESVMGDSVMGDSRNGYTHCASRAVVQDLEPKTEAVLGSRSLTASAVNHRSSLTAEISEAESNQLASKATALTALLIGIPKEMVAEIDGKDMLIESYGDDARDAWVSVGRFLERFYGDSQTDALDIANKLILTMTPKGVAARPGVRISDARPRSVLLAIEETLRKPPTVPKAAYTFVLRKLENSKANLELGGDGMTETERASVRHAREDAKIAPAIKQAIDGMTGPWRRRPTTGRADEQRTALRWLHGSTAVRQELAEACEKNFASWNQRLPGLDTVKENWIRAEAVKRWKAAGCPLPMPPR